MKKMASRKRKKKATHLTVIRGGGEKRTNIAIAELKKNPLYFLLLGLALFLLAQILVGWIWSALNRRSLQTVLAKNAVLEMTFSSSGLITFEEYLVFAPSSGFIYFEVEEGERVPVGKELALITRFPMEEKEGEEDSGIGDYLERIGDWFFHGRSSGEDYSHFFISNETAAVVSPLAGLVRLNIDGWESYGPATSFPYFTEKEFTERGIQEQEVKSGDRVLRSTPLLSIVKNYYWYYSAVLPPQPGETIAESSHVKIYFAFAPDLPVHGERVEVRKREGGNLEVTWRINKELPGFLAERWTEAAIVYQELEGTLIPRETVLERDGRKGVYTIERGYVVFREITVLGEKEGYYLVEEMEPYERIIARPSRVKEGQRFPW